MSKLEMEASNFSCYKCKKKPLFYTERNQLLCLKHKQSKSKTVETHALAPLIEEIKTGYEEVKYKLEQLVLLRAHMNSICENLGNSAKSDSPLVPGSSQVQQNIDIVLRRYHEVMAKLLNAIRDNKFLEMEYIMGVLKQVGK